MLDFLLMTTLCFTDINCLNKWHLKAFHILSHVCADIIRYFTFFYVKFHNSKQLARIWNLLIVSMFKRFAYQSNKLSVTKERLLAHLNSGVRSSSSRFIIIITIHHHHQKDLLRIQILRRHRGCSKKTGWTPSSG